MKNIKLVTEIKSKKDLKKALSNMINARVKKGLEKILEGGTVKFIKGGVKSTIKEMPDELKSDLIEFYEEAFESILVMMQEGEEVPTFNLSEKDSGILAKLNTYLESRFE